MFRLRKKELNLIYTSLQEGKPLPEKYRNIIFNNSRDVELVWKEKSSEVFDKTLDLLPIERSIESIAFNGCQASIVDSKKRWLNKLISGDNKLVLSSLKNGPLREEIENNGGIKLIYIDPPFDVGNDYHIDIEIGDTLIKKDPLVLVELAYKDTWGYGKDSFINMIYERLLIMHELISKDGSLYLHCDWRISGHMREILDEIFGAENFINEIIWHYPDKIPSGVQRLPQNHDTIFFYAKNKQNKKYNVLKVERETPIRLARKKWNPVLGKWRGYERDKDNNIIYDIVYNKIEDDVWRIPAAPVVRGRENLGYPTQKPKELLRRIILMSTDENDIVADFFSGSGTTLEVAQRLNRKWIGNDIGKFAINTSRKRMLGVLSQLKDEGKILKDFELLKVSSPIAKTFPIAPTFLDLSCKDESQACKDESQACKDESLTSNDESQACKDESLFVTDEKREKIFLKKILESYGAIKLEDSFFHGKKGKSNVFVGDKTLLDDFFPKLLKKCKTIGVNKVDVLAFAFEIGNYLKIFEIFKEHGINIALKYIPMDIFEKNQNIEDFDFRELGKITLKAKKRNNSVEVELSNYKCFYSQGEDSVKNLKNKSSLIKIHNGEVVKISRDKTGELDFEPLTKKWQDWVDFWAVDFNFGQNSLLDSRQDNSEKKHESIKPQANVFKYHWQSYRSRQDRSLELKSMFYTYQKPGRKTIAVKLIDILGNDSLALIEVDI